MTVGLIARRGLLLVGVLAALVTIVPVPRDAQPQGAPPTPFTGAYLRGTFFNATFGSVYGQPRIVCPPDTRATPRQGDFSFCTGSISLYRGARLAGRGYFSVRTNDSHIERTVIFPFARPLFRFRTYVAFGFRMVSHDGRGQVRTRTGTVRFRNPYGR